jgi:ribosome-binding protein aMBF1 (putative translation factor)
MLNIVAGAVRAAERLRSAIARAIFAPMTRLGLTVKRLRRRRGLTQIELAKKARLSQSFLSELETGTKVQAQIQLVARLARALGVALTELVP